MSAEKRQAHLRCVASAVLPKQVGESGDAVHGQEHAIQPQKMHMQQTLVFQY